MTARTPRTLLGWTVPDHIATWSDDGGIRLSCQYFHSADVTEIAIPEAVDGDARLGQFLREHAHGTPREWHAGDAEPTDGPDIRGAYRGLKWSYEAKYVLTPWRHEDGIRASWAHVLEFGAPLTEVLPDPAETGPQGCPERRAWLSGGDAKWCARPKGHPQPHRSSFVSESGTITWWDDEEPVPPAQLPQDSPNTATPASQDPETGSGELSSAEDMSDADIQCSVIGFMPWRLTSDARTWLTAILRDAAIQGWDVDECSRRAQGLLADWEARPGAPDSWYPAAKREHDRANAAELDRNAAARRAASWWEAAKKFRRCLNQAHAQLDYDSVEITNLIAVRDELAHQRDEARAKLDQVRAARDEVVGVWCALSEGERDEVDDVDVDLWRALEKLTASVNREAAEPTPPTLARAVERRTEHAYEQPYPTEHAYEQACAALYRCKGEREALQAHVDEHEDLLHDLWLYVKWHYVTKQLTTEQRNLWADAIEKVSEQLHPGEGAKADRWWDA